MTKHLLLTSTTAKKPFPAALGFFESLDYRLSNWFDFPLAPVTIAQGEIFPLPPPPILNDSGPAVWQCMHDWAPSGVR